MRRFVFTLCSLSVVACTAEDPPLDPVDGPTYARDLQPLLAEHCVGCHRDGGIGGFSLESYEEVGALAPLIAVVTRERTMPPWGVDNGGDCGTYRNARWLDDDAIETIAAWADAGAPPGDPDLYPPAPPPTGAALTATHEVGMAEPYTADAGLSDDYRCFVIEPAAQEDRYLTGYEVLPGAEDLVHHVILYTTTNEESDAEAVAKDGEDAAPGFTCFGSPGVEGFAFLAGWAPGTGATIYPEGTGIRVPGGRKLIMQVHYNLQIDPRPDLTRVALRLEASVARPAEVLPLVDLELELAPGRQSVSTSTTTVVEDRGAVDVYGVYPHMHLLGQSLEVTRARDGEQTCVTRVPSWDFEWQQFYFYDEPLRVIDGDEVSLRCTYDTGSQTEVVTWGDGTADEMCLVGVYFVDAPD